MLTAEPTEHLLVPEIRVAPCVPQVNHAANDGQLFCDDCEPGRYQADDAVLSVGIPLMQRISQPALKNTISLNGIAIVGRFLRLLSVGEIQRPCG